MSKILKSTVNKSLWWTHLKFYALIVLTAFCFSCAKDDTATNQDDYEPIPLQIEIPSNFTDLEYSLENNPITQAAFELGKDLFNEGKLSSNNAIPCAFCHE